MGSNISKLFFILLNFLYDFVGELWLRIIVRCIHGRDIFYGPVRIEYQFFLAIQTAVRIFFTYLNFGSTCPTSV